MVNSKIQKARMIFKNINSIFNDARMEEMYVANFNYEIAVLSLYASAQALSNPSEAFSIMKCDDCTPMIDGVLYCTTNDTLSYVIQIKNKKKYLPMPKDKADIILESRNQGFYINKFVFINSHGNNQHVSNCVRNNETINIKQALLSTDSLFDFIESVADNTNEEIIDWLCQSLNDILVNSNYKIKASMPLININFSKAIHKYALEHK